MRTRNLLTVSAVLIFFAGLGQAKTHPTQSNSKSASVRHTSVHHTTKKTSHHRTRPGAWKHHGQQGIQGDRAAEIQQALIREKYLDGSPSGTWDAHTQQAMARFQADHGWQAKVTPDSRALIKLGLGPSHDKDIVNLDSVSSSTETSSASPAASNSSRR
ncbi:MAG TPA: peptidoglycan-binding domain-containing protein [Candidatus Angelobacter sp.]|nr:peptidoglycan-binding domain-containing protein [Candidatus Angelobacter sp.]